MLAATVIILNQMFKNIFWLNKKSFEWKFIFRNFCQNVTIFIKQNNKTVNFMLDYKCTNCRPFPVGLGYKIFGV